MQKVIRRSRLAINQARRKAKIQEDREHVVSKLIYRQENNRVVRALAQNRRDERTRRRVDWELGPLSPWKHRFEELLAEGLGLTSNELYSRPAKPPRSRVKNWTIEVGDRVVIREGHERIKGRIGKIKDIDREAEAVQVENLNKVEIAVPESVRTTQPDMPEVHATEAYVPLDHVSLVYPLPDPQTGVPRDCILQNLVLRNRRLNPFSNDYEHDRFLEPQHIQIPWPPKKEPEFYDHPGDTLRINTEDQTYLPTLLRPPMPLSVIDELRNKYSAFRRRHDDEYIEKKEAEDREAQRQKDLATATLPHSSLKGAQALPQKDLPLSQDLAEKIGAHMAHRGVTINANGKLNAIA